MKLNHKVLRFKKTWRKKMLMKSIVYKQCCHRIEVNPCLSICNGTIERRFTRGPLFTRQSGSALYVCVKWLRSRLPRRNPLYPCKGNYILTASPGGNQFAPLLRLLRFCLHPQSSEEFPFLNELFAQTNYFLKGQLRNFESTFWRLKTYRKPKKVFYSSL